jgi:hypothetical protein
MGFSGGIHSRESELGTPSALFRLEAGDIAGSLGVRNDTARRLEKLLIRGAQVSIELDRLSTRGIWIVTRADESYPPLFRSRLKGTAPPVPFGAGNPSALADRSVAVVGSRDADEASTAFATALGHSCARTASLSFRAPPGASTAQPCSPPPRQAESRSASWPRHSNVPFDDRISEPTLLTGS